MGDTTQNAVELRPVELRPVELRPVALDVAPDTFAELAGGRRPSGERVQSIQLRWSGVTHIVQLQSGFFFNRTLTPRTILDGLAGAANPGELLAIMGPSGSGKTSLLNVLARRVKPVSGEILLNGKPLPKGYNRLAAYVMQDDLLMGAMTPRELLTFAANLRLVHLTSAERNERVEALIDVLGLKKCANTPVGNPFIRGISGGERKRTSVGYELITNPGLMFLDEPTSGLDAYSALILLETLRELAKQGRTIICTIHQPSSEIFEKFDKLYLLARGKLMYAGVAQKSMDFFAAAGHPVPEYSNPADFYMSVLHTEEPADFDRISNIAVTFAEHRDKGLVDAGSHSEIVNDVVELPLQRPNYFVELYYMSQRSWIDGMRNPAVLWGRIAQIIIIGMLTGAVFIPLGSDQNSLQSTTGSLFFVITGSVFSGLFAVLLTLPLERPILIREQYTSMYRISTYFLGKTYTEFLFGLIAPMINALLVYWFIGYQNTAEKFFIFYGILTLLGFTAGALGWFIGAAIPNPEIATGLGPLALLPMMLLGGLFVNVGSSLGWWLRWISYISFFRWALEALSINEFTSKTFYCEPNQFVYGPDGTPVCPVTNGELRLEQQSYVFRDIYPPALILLGTMLALRVGALFFLRFQTKRALQMN